MKKDTIEHLAKGIQTLRHKVVKAKSEEEIKEKTRKVLERKDHKNEV